jgi:Domain of unknown function (DUF6398)
VTASQHIQRVIEPVRTTMRLDPHDLPLFYTLHKALMFFVNQRLDVIGKPLDSPDQVGKLPPEDRIKLRDALLANMDLIDAFACENPLKLPEEELEIVRSWKHLVAGQFYVYRSLRKYTIFLTTREPVVAYGVLSLMDSFEDLIGPQLPYLCKAVLLPYKGQILYDGLLSGYNITFGSGVRRSLKDSYNDAKKRQGIITSLPPPAAEIPRPARPKPTTKRRANGTKMTTGDPSIPQTARTAHEKIVRITDAFCREHLDAEYGTLCRKLAGVLARKRPSPLLSGKPESWASGIVRVVGWVNFLSDPSQPGHMRMSDIDEGMGVSEATGSAKAKAIRDLLKMHPLDPEWTLPSRMEQNPMAWMIQVNGLIVDARRVPREIQEEAVRKGLIPYIPADQTSEIADE